MRQAPLIRIAPGEERQLTTMRWAFQPWPNLGKVTITNAHNFKSPRWSGRLASKLRCFDCGASSYKWASHVLYVVKDEIDYWLLAPRAKAESVRNRQRTTPCEVVVVGKIDHASSNI